jgi:hypothetical protein
MLFHLLEDRTPLDGWTPLGEGQPQIEILIGADAAGRQHTGNLVELRCGLVAVQMWLGWVVMGMMKVRAKHNTQATVFTTLLTQANKFEDLWKLEAIGITDACDNKTKDNLEKAVLDYIAKTVKFNSEGRYEVRLPLLDNGEDLLDNRAVSKKRLVSTNVRHRAEDRFEDYTAVFEERLREGLNEGVQDKEVSSGGHFLPHRRVFMYTSTTKVRPIFDASCKEREFRSLNDCLAKGHNVLELIPQVLLKIWEKRIGVISNIKKAFLQISVN